MEIFLNTFVGVELGVVLAPPRRVRDIIASTRFRRSSRSFSSRLRRSATSILCFSASSLAFFSASSRSKRCFSSSSRLRFSSSSRCLAS